MDNLKKQRGFTLIELLIIIVIIVILVSISVIALNGQRAKARDAKRISDVKQIRTALEFYYSDEGEYPIEANPVVLGSQNKEKLCSKSVGGFVATETECNQESIYMTAIPIEPLASQNFIYSGSADGYDITFTTEQESSVGPPGLYHAHSDTIDAVPGNR